MRQKILLIAGMLILISVMVSAQKSFNRFYIGGSAGFMYDAGSNDFSTGTVSSNSKTIGFSSLPLFGIYLSDRLLIGIEFEYGLEKTSLEKTEEFLLFPGNFSFNEIRTSQAGINLVAKYHWDLSPKVILAAIGGIGGGAGGTYITEKDSSGYFVLEDITESGIDYFTAFVSPQLQVYLTEHLGLNLSCNFLRYRFEIEQSIVSDANGLHNFDVSLKPEDWNFGVFYRF